MSKKTKANSKPPRASTPELVSAGFEGAARTTPMGIPDAFDFASDDAAEHWIRSGQPNLRPIKGSGADGAYTVRDVDAALQALGRK